MDTKTDSREHYTNFIFAWVNIYCFYFFPTYRFIIFFFLFFYLSSHMTRNIASQRVHTMIVHVNVREFTQFDIIMKVLGVDFSFFPLIYSPVRNVAGLLIAWKQCQIDHWLDFTASFEKYFLIENLQATIFPMQSTTNGNGNKTLRSNHKFGKSNLSNAFSLQSNWNHIHMSHMRTAHRERLRVFTRNTIHIHVNHLNFKIQFKWRVCARVVYPKSLCKY